MVGMREAVEAKLSLSKMPQRPSKPLPVFYAILEATVETTIGFASLAFHSEILPSHPIASLRIHLSPVIPSAVT